MHTGIPIAKIKSPEIQADIPGQIKRTCMNPVLGIFDKMMARHPLAEQLTLHIHPGNDDRGHLTALHLPPQFIPLQIGHVILLSRFPSCCKTLTLPC
ncbi:hypothetical protein D3C73_1331730 [compost metagenome]